MTHPIPEVVELMEHVHTICFYLPKTRSDDEGGKRALKKFDEAKEALESRLVALVEKANRLDWNRGRVNRLQDLVCKLVDIGHAHGASEQVHAALDEAKAALDAAAAIDTAIQKESKT